MCVYIYIHICMKLHRFRLRRCRRPFRDSGGLERRAMFGKQGPGIAT